MIALHLGHVLGICQNRNELALLVARGNVSLLEPDDGAIRLDELANECRLIPIEESIPILIQLLQRNSLRCVEIGKRAADQLSFLGAAVVTIARVGVNQFALGAELANRESMVDGKEAMFKQRGTGGDLGKIIVESLVCH
nr:hypothetical protein [Novosphingobium profundi]